MARTRAADFEEKQDAILKGAARLFAQQGAHRASMAQVAESLGVSKALLYHYYSSKDALIHRIVMDHLSELDAALEAAERVELSPDMRLRALIAATLECYRDADDAHKIQIDATDTLPEAEREEIRELSRRITHRFTRIIAELNPELRGVKLMPATMALFGTLNWAYMWFREGGPISRAAYAQLVADLFLSGVKTAR